MERIDKLSEQLEPIFFDDSFWKEKNNFIFLNKEFFDDEREALAKAIIDQFEFNEDGTLKGTMLAQNTSFEIGVLKELAKLFPEYSSKLLAICDKSADLLHLLSNNKEMYKHMKNADIFNYYHKDLSGGYSIKRTLPALVPSLTYKGMDVGNGGNIEDGKKEVIIYEIKFRWLNTSVR